MCAFSWKWSIVSAQRSILVGQYYHMNTEGAD